MNITALEKDFLVKVLQTLAEYGEVRAIDELPGYSTWTPTDTPQSVGVLSSLVKKGLIETDYSETAMKKGRKSKDSQCWLTPAGAAVCDELGLLIKEKQYK